MAAERNRWEARDCKEIDYTSASSDLHVARAFFILFGKIKGFIFGVYFVGRKGLLSFFVFFPNILEQS